jgi:1-acyl-sn-glycerol-3-phosphate acyltransferase
MTNPVSSAPAGGAASKELLDERQKLHNRILYRIMRYGFIGLFKVYNRITIEGTENIPEGACVWAPNHRSYIDTPIQAIVPARLRFMGKDTMWKNRFFGWIFTTIGCFPVVRGTADREALNTALGVLANGRNPVVAFPEGERKDGPRVLPLFDGAAYMAAKAQVPIVPVGIGGTAAAMPRGAKLMYPRKIHVIVGKPIDPPALTDKGRVSRKEVKAVTLRLREDIQEVFDRAMERVGKPNVYSLDDPDLAGPT